ncbi:MAG TPA: ATP-binding protein [Vicinamibacterales bacterium]|nr:ATP-binding protein [Vicinamibacterales bacterium]
MNQPLAVGRPDLLTTAMLRWFDDLTVQGILTTDAALVIRSWNRHLEEHSGIAAADAVGRRLVEVVPDIEARGLDVHFRAALAGEPRVLSHRFHRYLIPAAAGQMESAQTVRIAPLEVDGAIVGTIAIVEDVSDRVITEREMRRQIEAAETARSVAEEAVRVKDEFLATLSHEIRTPLNAVLGWTKILLGRQVDPAMLTRALQVIDRNAVAQTRLIDDMLDMARIMSGKLRLEMQPVDLANIAISAIDVVSPAATAKGISLLTKIDTAEPWMMGDPDRMQQIVWNLLSNAVKFTETGGRVTLGIARDGDLLRLWVEDTGRGVSPDFLPQMFERFRQADSSSSRRHGGLGLGLSLVRQLVELHGGQVSAASVEGQGSTFTVTFPARTELTADDASEAGEADPAALSGRRALLVEGAADGRGLVTAALQEFGVMITLAASSRDALSALDAAAAVRQLPDVIICDIGLPDEDGYRLMEQLSVRPKSRGGAIPVIALTSHGRPQDKRRALAAGFRLHLTKPVAPGALATAVSSVLAR